MSEPSPGPAATPPDERPRPPLPTSAQLDELEADLERIDAVLARLDAEAG